MKKKILSVLAVSVVVAGTLFSLNAQAFRQTDVDRVIKGRACYGGCDLSNADFHGINLRSLKVSDSKVYGANFSEADLTAAVFTRVIAPRTNFSGANLHWAGFYDSDLSGSKFNNASMSASRFTGTSLINADLSGADFRGADLSYSSLNGANLSDANLQGASLQKAKISGMLIDNADFTGAIWTDGRKCAPGSISRCI
jgi:uncharacterized protein YjbI with pentapeptide repeats